MKKKKTVVRIRLAVIAFVIIFILLYVIIYIVPHVTDIFTRTYTAEYGSLRTTTDVKCIFVRDEQVYRADTSGQVSRDAEEGTLLRAGSPVVSIGGSVVSCAGRGIVSYYYDGFEDRLNSEKMNDLTEDFFSGYAEEPDVSEMADTVDPGSPVFKIIDNKAWYLVFWADAKEAERFAEGARVLTAFDEDTEVEMYVRSVTAQGSSFRVILSCNRSYSDFDKYRVRECTVITSDNSGIILETDSIVEEDGIKGVYVLNKLGETEFVPVSIIASQGDRTVVEKNYYYDSEGDYVGTVQNYDEILKQSDEAAGDGSSAAEDGSGNSAAEGGSKTES